MARGREPLGSATGAILETPSAARYRRFALGSLLCWFVFVPLALGASVEEARRLWQRGNYQEAIEKYQEIPEPRSADWYLGLSRCHRSEGRYDEAAKVLREGIAKHPKEAELLGSLADLESYRGREKEARALVDQALAASNENLTARWVRVRLLLAQGKYDDVNRELEWFVHFYNDRQPTDPEQLLLVAKATAEYARRNRLTDQFEFILNELLVDAGKSSDDFWQARCEAGLLLLDKYNKTEAVPELKNALQINPNAVEVLVGLGISSLQDYDFADGTQFANQALAINPASCEALRLKGDLLLADSRTDEALAPLQKALAIHATDEETLGRLAAVYLLKGNKEEAAKIEREVLARNPKPGVYFTLVGDLLENRRQFDLAEAYFLRAIAATPGIAAPMNGLGLLYMRVGKEAEARKVLAEAHEIDPFHVRVSNMNKVLRHMESYKTIVSPHYEVLYDPKVDEILARHVSEYLERQHATLCKQFGYEPPGRSKIELMIDHKWFSARVVGLPSIGTVGACTGKVVAIASPRSLRTPYNWARVMTHEVTHVITLQQTHFNIPHWYTEALAVLSEGFPRPQIWNQLLAERVPKGELLNLDNINHAFVRPKTQLDWQMAYCQSLLYAQYMLERFGSDSLARLLKAYQDGLETDAAIPKVFQVTKADFEQEYRKYLEKLVKGLKVGESRPKRSFAELQRAVQKEPENAELNAELALQYLRRQSLPRARELADAALAKQKNHPIALYVLARMEWSIGKTDEAIRLLAPATTMANPPDEVLDLMAAIRLKQKKYDEAAALFEAARQRDPLQAKWVEGLARVYLLQGNNAKLRPALETLAGMDADDLNVRKKLAELAVQDKRWDDAERWARETLYVDVQDAEGHRILGLAELRRGRLAEARVALQDAVKLGSKNALLPALMAEATGKNPDEKKGKGSEKKAAEGKIPPKTEGKTKAP